MNHLKFVQRRVHVKCNIYCDSHIYFAIMESTFNIQTANLLFLKKEKDVWYSFHQCYFISRTTLPYVSGAPVHSRRSYPQPISLLHVRDTASPYSCYSCCWTCIAGTILLLSLLIFVMVIFVHYLVNWEIGLSYEILHVLWTRFFLH